MSLMWYPGQDVDFMRRLETVEKAVINLTKYQHGLIPSETSLTVDELEAENLELQNRINDLEELVIDLSEQVHALKCGQTF